MSASAPLPVAVFNDTRAARHYGCELVMANLVAACGEAGLAPAWFHPVRRDWREDAAAIPRAPDIAAVLVNGEGSLHHSATRERAAALARLAGFAHDTLGVPAFLVNATVEALDPATERELARFDAIYVREGNSRDELARAGIAATVVPDLTLARPLAAPGARLGTCATDSVIADDARALRRLAKRNGWSFRRMSVPDLAPEDAAAATADFLAWLGGHAMVVTGRFHTATLCLATGTPFVALESNTHKVSGMLRDCFGDTGRLLPASALDGLTAGFRRDWTPEETAAIARYLDRAREGAAAMFTAIRARIAAG